MQNKILNRLSKKQSNVLKKTGKLAEDLGMQAYLVGGVVRDLCLGRKSPDIDIVVVGDGIKFARRLADMLEGELKLYSRFGTATIMLGDGMTLDCVTARSEGYPRPGALPVVRPSTLEHDLFRRDFTINSMAISLLPRSYGRIVDPYNGLTDLKAKKIRVLHEKSFGDDPTRIFRAARFLERFGFSLELKTARYLGRAVKGSAVGTVTPTRLFHEIVKICEEQQIAAIFRRLSRWGIKNSLVRNRVMPVALFRQIERRREKLIRHERFFHVVWKDVFITAFFAGLSPAERTKVFRDVQISKKEQKAVLARISFHQELEQAASKTNGIYDVCRAAPDPCDLAYALAVTNKVFLLKQIA